MDKIFKSYKLPTPNQGDMEYLNISITIEEIEIKEKLKHLKK